MNDSTKLDLRPEVAEYVAAVRAHLVDLTEEEREELVGGLEADLSELAADHGGAQPLTEVIGPPEAYADELRAAAGLRPASQPTGRRSPSRAVEKLFASSRRAYAVALSKLPGSPHGFLLTVQPVWWVVRGWVAVELVDYFFGSGVLTVVPTLHGPRPGALLVAVSVLLSIQLGRGVLWPAVLVRPLGARILTLTLNFLAVAMLPVVTWHLPHSGTAPVVRYVEVSTPASPVEGLALNGRPVINLFPYDARGKPLQGVQLFNENGEPVVLNKEMATAEGDTITYPWLRSGASVWNVFPMPVGPLLDDPTTGFRDDNAWFGSQRPVLPASPVTGVRPVSLPKAAR
jgi:hypothetical protein